MGSKVHCSHGHMMDVCQVIHCVEVIAEKVDNAWSPWKHAHRVWSIDYLNPWFTHFALKCPCSVTGHHSLHFCLVYINWYILCSIMPVQFFYGNTLFVAPLLRIVLHVTIQHLKMDHADGTRNKRGTELLI